MTDMKCNKLFVPFDCCFLQFNTEEEYDHSIEVGMTSRGEDVILDVNKKGEIIGIELLGVQKPCQCGTEKNKEETEDGSTG